MDACNPCTTTKAESSANVLVVDDEKAICEVIGEALEREGHRVRRTETGAGALAEWQREQFDLVILDIRLPDMSGIEVLRQLRLRSAGAMVPVIIITGHASLASAVEALQMGAIDYLQKPLSMASLAIRAEKALEPTRLRRQNRWVAKQLLSGGLPQGLIGASSAMKRVHEQLAVLARTDTNCVLLTGETGTGKSLVAQLLHRLSARAKGPFVSVNCAAIPDDLFEAEMFGYRQGAFTGADNAHEGCFQQAQGGTLLLDAVGELPLLVQPKLLYAIETKRVRRLGAKQEVAVDARLVAASNRRLSPAEDPGFRSDLFYRLSALTLHLPPLRERREDILPLARHFTEQFAGQFGKQLAGLAPETEALLLGHPWFGNVRELANVVERAVLFEDTSQLTPRHLLLAPAGIAEAPRRACALPWQVSRDQLEGAMTEALGNKTRAAQLLGMSRPTLRKRLRECGWIDDLQQQQAPVRPAMPS